MPPGGSFFNDGRERELRDYVFSQDLTSLRNNPEAVLDSINQFVKTQKGMMIFQDYKLEVAHDILSKLETMPKIIVELGTYVGNSAVAWGSMLKEFNGSNFKTCKVFSMELEPDFVEIARSFVDLAGLNDVVEILQGEAATSLKQLKTHRGINHIDMLFIDHWEKFYLSDLRLCEELGLIGPGTIIIADNTDIPGAPDYVNYIKSGGENSGYKYSSQTISTRGEPGKPNVLEVSTVVQAH